MIRLNRLRDPAQIPAKYHSTAFHQKCLQLFRDKRDGQPLNSAYWKSNNYWSDSKPTLVAESLGNCAYCELPFAAGGYGDVEHFRPKSIYWWLAYCYDNYAFSCQICNQRFKSDEFPIEDPQHKLSLELTGTESDTDLEALIATWVPNPVSEANLAWADWQTQLEQEKALLPHPYLDDPEQFLTWEADRDQKWICIKPSGTSARAQRRAEAVEDSLGLNRDDLKRVRWAHYRPVELMVKSVQSNALPADLTDDIRTQLLDYWNAQLPFSGMIRFFLRKWKMLTFLGV